MINDDFFNRFQNHFEKSINGTQALGDELKQVMQVAINKTLAELDVVSREEFDTQQMILARSREKIDRLEKQLAAIEQHLNQE
jgi:BMFP domain-containing protein YqiC